LSENEQQISFDFIVLHFVSSSWNNLVGSQKTKLNGIENEIDTHFSTKFRLAHPYTEP
jgi:hypothetical protein